MEGILNTNEDAIFAEYSGIIDEKKEADLFGAQEKILAFRDRLQTQGLLSAARNTRTYQKLSGAYHPEQHDALPVDLPGGEIERFIREEL